MGVTVAVWQCAPTPRNPTANAARLAVAAATAAERGAAVLVAPELTLTGYDIGGIDPGLTQGAVERVAEIAGEAGVAVIAGVARHDEAGRLRNSAVAADSLGRVRAIHDKAHLFGAVDERFTPGDRAVTLADLDGLRVAVLVCYEIEFPEPARLAAGAGVDLIAVPTANMAPFAGVHDVLVPARALENATPLAYANHIGAEGGTRYLGRSQLVHGDGRVQAEGSGDAEELLVARLLPGSGTQIRDRRAEVLGGIIDEGET